MPSYERHQRYSEFSKKRSNRIEKRERIDLPSRLIVYADSSLSVCKYTLPVLQDALGLKAKVSAAITYDDLLQLAFYGKSGNQADGVLLDSTFENWHEYSALFGKPKPMFSYRDVSDSLSAKGFRGPIVGLFGYEREDIGVGWYTNVIKRIIVRDELEVSPELVLKALGIP